MRILESILTKARRIIYYNRHFILLWLAQIFTQSSVSIISVLIGILSHEGILSNSTKNSAFGIGIIINLSSLPAFIAAPIAGVLADWFPKKRIMFVSNMIRLVLLLPFIIFIGWENRVFSYILIFLLSMVLQFFMPAEGGLIPRVVRKSYLLLANSLFSLTVYSTLAIGVFFSGILLNIFGIRETLIICSILFVVSSILLLNVKIDDENDEGKSFKYFFDFCTNLIKDVKKGLLYASKNKLLRFALVHLFLLQIIALTLVTLVFRIGSEIYGVSPRDAGFIVFAPLIAGLIISVILLNVAGRQRNRIKLIWIGTLVTSIGFIFMDIIIYFDGALRVVLLDKIIASISLMAIGLGIPFLLIPAQTLIYENTEKNFLGRILGLWFAFSSSIASFFPLIIGFITDKLGNISFVISFVAIGDIIYSGIIFSLFKKRRI
jgi:MFS family permease